MNTTNKSEIDKLLDAYNWAEAFGYCGDRSSDPCGSGDPTAVLPDEGKVSLEPVLRSAVVEIIGESEGERDERPWYMVGRVADGRYFYLEAGCDYTGWDCRADGSCVVSNTRENILRFGVTDSAREAMGMPTP